MHWSRFGEYVLGCKIEFVYQARAPGELTPRTNSGLLQPGSERAWPGELSMSVRCQDRRKRTTAVTRKIRVASCALGKPTRGARNFKTEVDGFSGCGKELSHLLQQKSRRGSGELDCCATMLGEIHGGFTPLQQHVEFPRKTWHFPSVIRFSRSHSDCVCMDTSHYLHLCHSKSVPTIFVSLNALLLMWT